EAEAAIKATEENKKHYEAFVEMNNEIKGVADTPGQKLTNKFAAQNAEIIKLIHEQEGFWNNFLSDFGAPEKRIKELQLQLKNNQALYNAEKEKMASEGDKGGQHDVEQKAFKAAMREMNASKFDQKFLADANDPIKNMQDEMRLAGEEAEILKEQMSKTANIEEYDGLVRKLEEVMLLQKHITDEIKHQGREITNSVDPAEKFKQEVESLQELLAAGAIDQGTYDKKVMQDRKKMFQEQMSLSGSGGTPHFASAASVSQAIVDHMKHSGQDIAKQHLAVAQKTLDAIITLAGAQQAQKQMTSIAGI
ncbi:MAG TPA: hypothetical protein VN516_08590, partial [Candidatus Baltobacteraceae bacterium]|nr:hypothetical protein [Candidatus Baltobacteraceae bacterium]